MRFPNHQEAWRTGFDSNRHPQPISLKEIKSIVQKYV